MFMADIGKHEHNYEDSIGINMNRGMPVLEYCLVSLLSFSL